MTYFRIFIQAPAEAFWYITKSRPLSVVVSALLVLSFCTNLQSGYYMGKWIPVLAACALFAVEPLYRYYGAALAINFLYCVGSVVWVASYENRYATVSPYDLQGIKMFAIDAGWKLAIAAAPMIWFAKNPSSIDRLRETGRAFCTLFFCISAVKVGWEWAFDGCSAVNACGGSLMNPSLNSSMMAVVLPLTPFPLCFAIVAAGCAFLGKTSIGAGMVALFVAGYVAGKRKKKLGLLLAATAGVGVMGLGYWTHGGKAFFDSSGRFQMWRFFMWCWSRNYHNWVFGTGFGTFGPFSLNLQHWFSVNASDWWIWPHNDWLEQIFVGGGIGGLLLVWLYLTTAAALLLKGYFAELAALCLFGVAMGCEYVLHIGPCCAFALWILTIALFTPNLNSLGETQ